MGIVRFALRFPHTFYVLAALILFLGVAAIRTMPTDIFPEIRIPVVTVIWTYTGLSTPEIARSDKRTRALTSEQVRSDIQLIAALRPAKDKRTARSRAILAFSALVGAMSLARAVSDVALSREILETVTELLKNSASKHPFRDQRP